MATVIDINTRKAVEPVMEIFVCACGCDEFRTVIRFRTDGAVVHNDFGARCLACGMSYNRERLLP